MTKNIAQLYFPFSCMTTKLSEASLKVRENPKSEIWMEIPGRIHFEGKNRTHFL